TSELAEACAGGWWCGLALLGDLFRRLAGPDSDGDRVPAGRFAEDLARCGWLAATGAAPSRRVARTSSPPTVTARCSAVAHAYSPIARPLHAARDGTYQAATLLHPSPIEPRDPAPRITVQEERLMPERTRKCPFCAEEIRAEAIRCPFCRSRLGASDREHWYRGHPERRVAGVA